MFFSECIIAARYLHSGDRRPDMDWELLDTTMLRL